MPHDLHALILAHKRPLLTLLFNAARQTLGQFGQRTLGGQIGCTMVLHTWDQTLGLHCHVHCIMAAGALSAKGTLPLLPALAAESLRSCDTIPIQMSWREG